MSEVKLLRAGSTCLNTDQQFVVTFKSVEICCGRCRQDRADSQCICNLGCIQVQFCLPTCTNKINAVFFFDCLHNTSHDDNTSISVAVFICISVKNASYGTVIKHYLTVSFTTFEVGFVFLLAEMAKVWLAAIYPTGDGFKFPETTIFERK